MSIQTKLILIGAIFTILLVLIHPVPQTEKQKLAKERAKRNDPLMSKIEDYNKNPMNGLGGHVYVPPDGMTKDDIQKLPPIGNGNNPYVKSYKSGPNQSSFSQQYYGQQGGNAAPANRYPQQPPQQQQQPSQPQGYYPPPPLQDNSARSYSPRSMNSIIDGATIKGHTTSEGQQIAYSGVYVYKIKADGTRGVMPDGNYKTEYGTNLIVRDGKKLIINNN